MIPFGRESSLLCDSSRITSCRCYLLIVARFIRINRGLSSHRDARLHLSVYRLSLASKNIRRVKPPDVIRTWGSLSNAHGLGCDTWSYWSPSQVTNHSVSEAGSASVFKGEVREDKHTVSGPSHTAGSDPLDHCQCPTFQTRLLP